jgi:hypothetical protein
VQHGAPACEQAINRQPSLAIRPKLLRLIPVAQTLCLLPIQPFKTQNTCLCFQPRQR